MRERVHCLIGTQPNEFVVRLVRRDHARYISFDEGAFFLARVLWGRVDDLESPSNQGTWNENKAALFPRLSLDSLLRTLIGLDTTAGKEAASRGADDCQLATCIAHESIGTQSQLVGATLNPGSKHRHIVQWSVW